MKLKLEKLKNYLMTNGIRNFRDIGDIDVKNIIIDISKNIEQKTITSEILVLLLTTEDNFYCECKTRLRTYDVNKKMFRTHCKYCKSDQYDISGKIKLSRKLENTFDGLLLNKKEIISELKRLDTSKILGSGQQRRFIKKHKQLYHSILHGTDELDCVKGITIRARIIHLLEDAGTCKCGAIVSRFDTRQLQFYPWCNGCTPRKNSLEYYKGLFPKTFKLKYKEDRENRKEAAKGLHTLNWYNEKYGELDGPIRYQQHVDRMLSGTKITHVHSKISLSLFNDILLCGNFDDAEFAGHPKEKMFRLSEPYAKRMGQSRIFVDFVFENKIIEFQGNYWHKLTKQKDDIRKEFLKSLGYDVLFIYENEYKADKIREVDKCVRFLNGSMVQNRYKILTSSGYKDFDNIISNGVRNTLVFKLENGKNIETSTNHKFIVNNKTIVASDLSVGDVLQTLDGNTNIVNITKSNTEVFDVLETETHNYFANSVLNHNCEFVGSSHTLISAACLRKLEHAEIEEKRDGKLRIYHYPEKHHKYLMSVDPAKDGSDSFAVQIVDITDFNFKQVATAQLQIDYLLMPEFLFEWAELYNNPYMIIENNEGAGQSIADQLYQTYEYENLHFDKDVVNKKRKKYPGFRTTTKSRKQVLQTLKLFMENDSLEINDKNTISELFQFILLNKKYQADDGAHDDLIMALALVFVPFCNTKNFEDMKLLVQNLYRGDELEDADKVNFGDLLTIGSFEDYSDEDYAPSERTIYSNIEDAIINDSDGFI